MLGVAYVAAYLFLFVSMRRGIAYAVGTGLLFTALVAAVTSRCDFYWEDTILVAAHTASWSARHLVRQIAYFAFSYIGLVLLAVDALRDGEGLPRWPSLTDAMRRCLRPWEDRPVLPAPVDICLFCGCASLAVLLLRLGWSYGAFGSYWTHLLAPFPILYVFSSLAHRWKPWFTLPLLVSVATIVLVGLPWRDFRASVGSWRTIESIIRGHDAILNSPVVGGLLVENGRTVWDSGQTEYFPNSGTERARRIWEEYNAGVRSAIERQAFDAVLIEPQAGWKWLVGKEKFEQLYELQERFDLIMLRNQRWTVEYYLPRRREASP